MICRVQLATGTVVGGAMVVEGVPFPEGTIVAVLARDADAMLEVPPELEPELAEALARAAGGETPRAAEMHERPRPIA